MWLQYKGTLYNYTLAGGNARVQRMTHGEPKEVISSDVKSNTTIDNYNDNNNNDRFEAVSSFIPLGLEIHWFSLIFLRTGSSFLNFSMTMTDMSSIECLALLKWVATGFSSILLCTMSAQWLFSM